MLMKYLKKLKKKNNFVTSIKVESKAIKIN